MGLILLIIPASILLIWILARPPRRVEGLLVAYLLPICFLFAYVAWHARTSDLDPADVNINSASAAEIAQGTGIPIDIADGMVRLRLSHGAIPSLSDIPTLGSTSEENRRYVSELAAKKNWKALRAIARFGKISDSNDSDQSGLYPNLDLRVRAMQALPGKIIDLQKSPRAVLIGYLGNEPVVDRIIQFRTTEWKPYPDEILRISDIPSIPKDRVVLRTREEAFSLYWKTIALLLAMILGMHIYLRVMKSRADEFLLPLMGSLGVIGVVMLFSVASPLKVSAAFLGMPLLIGGHQPKYLAQALAVLLGLALLPFAYKLVHRIGRESALGAIAIAVIAPLAANAFARWGTVSIPALLLLGAGFVATAHYLGKNGSVPQASLSDLTKYVAAGILITIVLVMGRLVAGKSGYAPFLEFARIALIVYTARLCDEHDFFLGGKLKRLPASAVIPFVLLWLVALVLTILAREMGVLLLLWIPCILLIGYAFSWREVLAGLGLLAIGGKLVLWLGIGPFRDRVAMWLNPWHYIPSGGYPFSAQMAQAWQRMASVPNPIAGLGLGRSTSADFTTNTQDLILPLYYEQLGFVGVALIIVLFLMILHRLFRISLCARDRFDHWLGLGFASVLTMQTVYIIGANFGAWPLTGVTLAPLAFGKAACLTAFTMVWVVLGISGSGDELPMGLVPVRRKRAVAWTFAAFALLSIYAAGKAIKIGVIDRNENAFAHYGSNDAMNTRIWARLSDLPRGCIIARTNSASYQNTKTLAKPGEKKDERVYSLGPAAWPVVGVSCKYGTTGGERDWLGRLTGVYSLVQEESRRGTSNALETALLDQWRAEHHPLWHARSQWREKLVPRDVQTSIISSLQVDAYQRLSEYLSNSMFRNGLRPRKGAILLADIRTGEILAKAQFPSVDPNLLSSGWMTWDRCATDPSGYFDPNGQIIDLVDNTDRAPGSTAKLNTIMALLSAGEGGRRFWCGPGVKVNGHVIRDFHNGQHGWVNAEKILKYSCNRGAAQAAEIVGPRRLLSLYREKLRYSLPHMDRPARSFRKDYDKIAFGQVISASLEEMMITLCAIARGGEAIEPHVLHLPPDDVDRWRVCSRATAGALSRYMISVAKPGGTAYVVYNGKVAWPSKTGSAEVAGATKTDAWFVGFAPAQKPRVAFVLWVEEDGTGGNMANNIGVVSVVNHALSALGN